LNAKPKSGKQKQKSTQNYKQQIGNAINEEKRRICESKAKNLNVDRVMQMKNVYE
jgi:hypothetical protein